MAHALDFVALQKVVFDWATAVLVADHPTIIHEYQAAPRPAKPFVTIKLAPIRKVGSIDEVVNGSTVKMIRQFTVAVKVFADDISAFSIASDLDAGLEQPQFINILNAGGLSVMEVRPIMDLSALMETKFDRVALLEFSVLTAASVAYLGGEIAETDLSGTVGVHPVTVKVTKN